MFERPSIESPITTESFRSIEAKLSAQADKKALAKIRTNIAQIEKLEKQIDLLIKENDKFSDKIKDAYFAMMGSTSNDYLEWAEQSQFPFVKECYAKLITFKQEKDLHETMKIKLQYEIDSFAQMLAKKNKLPADLAQYNNSKRLTLNQLNQKKPYEEKILTTADYEKLLTSEKKPAKKYRDGRIYLALKNNVKYQLEKLKRIEEVEKAKAKKDTQSLDKEILDIIEKVTNVYTLATGQKYPTNECLFNWAESSKDNDVQNWLKRILEIKEIIALNEEKEKLHLEKNIILQEHNNVSIDKITNHYFFSNQNTSEGKAYIPEKGSLITIETIHKLKQEINAIAKELQKREIEKSTLETNITTLNEQIDKIRQKITPSYERRVPKTNNDCLYKWASTSNNCSVKNWFKAIEGLIKERKKLEQKDCFLQKKIQGLSLDLVTKEMELSAATSKLPVETSASNESTMETSKSITQKK